MVEFATLLPSTLYIMIFVLLWRTLRCEYYYGRGVQYEQKYGCKNSVLSGGRCRSFGKNAQSNGNVAFVECSHRKAARRGAKRMPIQGSHRQGIHSQSYNEIPDLKLRAIGGQSSGSGVHRR